MFVFESAQPNRFSIVFHLPWKRMKLNESKVAVNKSLNQKNNYHFKCDTFKPSTAGGWGWEAKYLLVRRSEGRMRTEKLTEKNSKYSIVLPSNCLSYSLSFICFCSFSPRPLCPFIYNFFINNVYLS